MRNPPSRDFISGDRGHIPSAAFFRPAAQTIAVSRLACCFAGWLVGFGCPRHGALSLCIFDTEVFSLYTLFELDDAFLFVVQTFILF